MAALIPDLDLAGAGWNLINRLVCAVKTNGAKKGADALHQPLSVGR